MGVVTKPVTVTLGSAEYEMQNTLQVRKQLCIHLGGLRPVLEAVMNLDQWRMAQVIAIASGKPKAVDAVFEGVFEQGATSVAGQIGDYVSSLLDDGEEKEKNAETETGE